MRTRESYGPRLGADNLTRAGAEALADKLRAYWFRKGKFPNIRIEKQHAPNAGGETGGMYCVRSDMSGGQPA